MTDSRFDELDREQLARLVPELLLTGQLIDRSGMAWCLSALGREGMTEIAIEEWMAASPIYTRRMQRALGYEGDDVVTIFKGLQLDIGAPPQFMDFRYTVRSPWSGEFHLAHCGALMDVEPMGEDMVTSMCHDIEDPTFDATAVATNPRAQVRPVHRPPRSEDYAPHCRWTVIIDESHPPVSESDGCRRLQQTRAAALELDPIDPDEEGAADYAGPLVSDLDFHEFSRSALVRIADEVCLQMHLLVLGFRDAVEARLEPEEARRVCVKQLTGIAGVAAERIRAVLRLGAEPADALAVLRCHPLLNPARYVDADVGEALEVRPSPAHDDGAWLAWCGPHEPAPLAAIARAVDPHLGVAVEGDETAWRLTLTEHDEPQPEHDEVAVCRISTGASFEFEPRRSLPIAFV